MKTYSAKTRTSKNLKAVIQNCIDYNEKYNGCYFWKNTGNASSRRSQEKSFEANNPCFKIDSKKGLIQVTPSLHISCKNFYYSLEILIDGKKSNIKILKNFI